MTHSFGAGRLNAEWLETPPTGPDSVWQLETTDPSAEGHRDAFLGNGYIGQRIGVSGDASTYGDRRFSTTPSGCLMHGLWNETTLMSPPRWALLGYSDGICELDDQHGTWHDYRQRLDLKRAILTTSMVWENGSQRSALESRCFLSRSRPNVAVLERTLTPNFNGRVSFTDVLDGEAADDVVDFALKLPESNFAEMSLNLTMGPRHRRICVMSMLHVEGAADVTFDGHDEGARAQRRVSFAVEAGKQYRVRKVVALVTDGDAPNPWSVARMLVRGAMLDFARLEREHVQAWSQLWEHRIETSHQRLHLILNASLYQFYSSLREGLNRSLGPCGLSSNHWKGHAFWDSDLWMFPGLCLVHPQLASGMVRYRKDTLEGARRNARAEGHAGAMFAWESAEFGDETIPSLVYHHQHHVNSDVALAQWFFYLISGDRTYLRETAAPIIIASARFWVSWADYNEQHDRYEIRRVCCADEFAEIQDNNAYTNYSAVKTIRLAQRVGEILDIQLPAHWDDVASKMWVPFDEEQQRYIEYEGYNGEVIKQADTALLVYPYEMPMSEQVKANVVDYYRSKYPEGNIMMAAAFDGIVDCELRRATDAWSAMLKLMPHFREPYLLVSESPLNDTISFHTGLGGLLQLVLMGFAGIRMREDALSVDPCLPDAIERIHIRKMCYAGVTFDLVVEKDGHRIENAEGEIPFACIQGRLKSS